jgi:hypothetical protein
MRRSLLLVCLAASALVADPPPKPELERLNSVIEELTALKIQAAAMEERIATLVRALSEQRGALQAKPASYDALKSVAADSPADTRPPLVRCAALTSAGKRCTRAAMEGSRYCKQHQLARQK